MPTYESFYELYSCTAADEFLQHCTHSFMGRRLGNEDKQCLLSIAVVLDFYRFQLILNQISSSDCSVLGHPTYILL